MVCPCVSVPQGKPLLPVNCRLSPTYCFQGEDPEVYSDSEEPHQWFNREAYPQVNKRTHQPGPQTVAIIQPVPVASTSGQKEKGALKRMAKLVQEQKETLEGAGVGLPGPSKLLPAAKTVQTATPKGKLAELKKGSLKCPVCKKEFTQASKCKSHYETTHSYQSEQHFCNTCQSPFSSKGALERHMAMHEKFACHWPAHHCQPFDTLQDLRDHLEQEAQFRDWSVHTLCKFCLRHFSRRDSTRKHQHKCIHNPDRVIQYCFCRHCGARYNEKKHRNNHKRECLVTKSVVKKSTRRAAANKARAKKKKQ